MTSKQKKTKWNKLNRRIHYWGASICAIPVLIVIVSGVILLLKKDIDWIQPSSLQGQAKTPTIPFEQVLNTAKTIKKANIQGWDDIDRLDVRPSKGIIKIRAENLWEIQLDHQTGEILQVAYRRSDLIESIHDGSFFHDYAKYGVFLPSSVVLLVLWITGIYLFVVRFIIKNKKNKTALVGLQ